jgi:hypothetical protein
MNTEKFLALTIEGVSQVYMGKRNCCRCGCGGDYTATSFMQDPRSKVNDSLVAKRLKRAQELVRQGADTEYGDTWIDVETGQDRTLTFYVDDLKK